MDLIFKILRFDPAVDPAPGFREYTIEMAPGERLLDGLQRIKWRLDGTLAFRLSCAHGVCGSCAMKINGRCALACQTLAGSIADGVAVIEPLPNFPVLKDLIVDLDEFFRRVALIRPYLIAKSPAPERERLQTPKDRKKIDEVIRCILCASCVGACPVSRDNPDYLGPAPLVQAFRRIFDSRDDEALERLRQAAEPDAAPACVNAFECTRVCPKEIPVTKSINFLKREIKRVLEERT